MTMARKDFVDKLGRVSPALSGNDLIPILTHFCFADGEVTAYNDQIGISAPCKTGFEGCVPGGTALGLLNASRATNLDFSVKKGEEKGDSDELTIKAASSKLKLPLLQVEDFDEVWTMPKPEKKLELPVDTRRFLAAIDCCMRSVSIDTSVPDQLGVTLMVDGKDLLMFSTDNSTLSHAILPLKSAPSFKRVILSAHFCREMLTLADKSKPLHLEVHDDGKAKDGDYSLLVNGNSTLFGKLIESWKPVDFIDALNKHLPPDEVGKFVSIPTKLEMIIERACIVAAASIETVRTEVAVKKGKASFYTASKKGIEAYDTLELEPKQADVELAVDPKLLKRGYGAFEKMMLTPSCFIMSGKDLFYLVGS